MSMEDDHTCRLVDKGTVCVRMYDETLKELNEVRYIPRITKNLISVGALEEEGLREPLKDVYGPLVVPEDIRRNNVYYLMGSTVIGLGSSGQLDGDSIRL